MTKRIEIKYKDAKSVERGEKMVLEKQANKETEINQSKVFLKNVKRKIKRKLDRYGRIRSKYITIKQT